MKKSQIKAKTPFHPFETVVSENSEGKYTLDILTGGHKILADEPISKGGTDLGPSPYDLLLSSLGSCTAITIRMYANMKKIPLKNISVTLSHKKIYVDDCKTCDGGEGMIDLINREIKFTGDLSASDTKKLLIIADKCPVHKTLTQQIRIDTRLEE